MKIKSRIISVIHRFLLSKGKTDFLRILRYRSILENIGYAHIAGVSASTHVQSDSDPGYMAANIRNGNPRRNLSSIPYESVHGGISHYPREPHTASRRDSFSFVKTSKKTKRNLGRTYLPHAGKQICHHVIELRRSIQRLSWLDDATIPVLSLQAAPTYDTGIHTVGNELRPMTRYRYHLSSISAGLFFEHNLNLRIGTSNHWPRFSQPKTKLPEKSLALTYSHFNPKVFPDKG